MSSDNTELLLIDLLQKKLKLRTNQVSFAFSEEQNITFVTHRHSGKTEAIVQSVIFNAFVKPNQKIIILAPTIHMVNDIFSRITFRINSIFDQKAIKHNRIAPCRQVVLGNNTKLSGFSSKSKALRGQDADIMYVDEAQTVDKETQLALWPIIVSSNCRLFTAGTFDSVSADDNMLQNTLSRSKLIT